MDFEAILQNFAGSNYLVHLNNPQLMLVGLSAAVALVLSLMIIKYLRHEPCPWSEKSFLAAIEEELQYNIKSKGDAKGNVNSDWVQHMTREFSNDGEGEYIQGLVGVLVVDNVAAMVEINIDLDIALKSEVFHKFVELAAYSVLKHCTNSVRNATAYRAVKVSYDATMFQSIKSSEDKPLSQHASETSPTLNNNQPFLHQAICLKVPPTKQYLLSGFAYPTGKTVNHVMLGKIGTIAAFNLSRCTAKDTIVNDVADKVCQHVVARAPEAVGSEDDVAREDDDDEIFLVHQKFLHNEKVTVGSVLNDINLTLMDFRRVDCGAIAKFNQKMLKIK